MIGFPTYKPWGPTTAPCGARPTEEEWAMFTCTRLKGHTGDHVHTSATDGRSIWWNENGKVQ